MLRWIELILLALFGLLFSIPVYAGGTANLSFTDGAAYNFGTQSPLSPVTYLFSVKNKGPVNATAVSFSPLSAPFAYAGGTYPGTGGNCGSSLASHQTCTVAIQFAPISTATVSFNYRVNYHDGNSNNSDVIALSGTGTAPAVLMITSSPSYSFPLTEINQVTVNSFTITNSGSTTASNLVYNSLTNPFRYLGGNYPGSGGTCGASLAGANASCTIVLAFAPTVVGNFSSALNLGYNDGYASRSLAESLSGTATSPALLSISNGPTYHFTSLLVGQSSTQLFTIANSGSRSASALSVASLSNGFAFNGGSYPGTGGTCSTTLAGSNATCTIDISFNPTIAGTYSSALTLNYFDSNSNQSTAISLSGIGLAPANLTSSPSNYDYGNRVVGSVGSYTFNITNSGQTVASNLNTSATAPFRIAGGTCSNNLNPDSSCNLIVEYAPNGAGVDSGSWSMSYYDGTTTRNLSNSIYGVGLNPGFLVSSDPGGAFNFGPQSIQSSTDHTFTITNTGEVSVSGLSIPGLALPFQYKGGSFPGVGGTCGSTINASASCTVVAQFLPTAAGSFSAGLHWSYGNGLGVTSIDLSFQGTANTPALLSSADGNAYHFPNLIVGQSTDHAVVLTNSGQSSASNLAGNILSAPFTYKDGTYPGTGGDCAASLPAGASCTIVVTAAPTTNGSFSTTLSLTYQDSIQGASLLETLNINAIATANLTFLEGSSFDFGSISTTSVDHAFTLSNVGGSLASQIATAAMSGPFNFKGGAYPGTGGTCSSSLSSGSSCQVVLSFTPSTTGSETGSFSLNYSNGIGNQTVRIDLKGSSGSAPGQLDLSFHSTGFNSLSAGSGDSVGRGLAIQIDGKAVLVGSYLVGNTSSFVVARFNTDGSPDSTFGSSGVSLLNLNSTEAKAYAVAIQGDGKIVVAGYTYNGFDKDVAVARLTSSGNLDTTFNRVGYRKDDIGGMDDVAYSVAIQSDGKILVAGYTFLDTDDDFLAIRYTATGSLDTPFNGSGVSAIDFGYGKDRASSMVLQPDGKIVLAGMSTGSGSTSVMGLARFNANGSYDSTFGVGSIRTLNVAVSSFGTSLAMMGTSVIASGYSYDGSRYSMVMSKLTPAGNLDSSFANSGSITLSVGSGNSYAMATAITQDGKILCGGYRELSPGSFGFTIARITSSGNLDNVFGNNGIAETNFAGQPDSKLYALKLQSDGKIVAAGSLYDGAKQNFAVARFTP